MEKYEINLRITNLDKINYYTTPPLLLIFKAKVTYMFLMNTIEIHKLNHILVFYLIN